MPRREPKPTTAVAVRDIVGWPEQVSTALETARAAGAVMHVVGEQEWLPDGRVHVQALIPTIPAVAAEPTRPGVGTRLWRFLAPEPLTEILTPGESCRVETRRHWLLPLKLVVKGLVWLPVAFALSHVLAAMAVGVWWLQVLLWLAPVGNLVVVGYRWLLWMADRVIVTDRRLILASGVFHRVVNWTPLSSIKTMDCQRTLLGRVLGYGTFRVESSGGRDSMDELIAFVPDPRRVYRETLARRS